MILTVTMNPSVDTRYQLDELVIDDVNRVTPEKTAGGKGLNVARVLGQLGDDVVATGLLGGHMGAYMEELMDANGIKNDFVPIKGETRICLNILHAGNQTELLESGPTIAPEELDAFTAKFAELASKADVVTISGSLPRGVEADYYAKITGIAENAGAKVLLDTSGASLEAALKSEVKPELVKPNLTEINGLLGTSFTTDDVDELRAALASDARFSDIPWVVVSMGAAGSVGFHNGRAFRAKTPDIPAVNATGSGDSTIAGFAHAIAAGADDETVLRTANTCGKLNAMDPMTGHLVMDRWDEVLEIEVGRIARNLTRNERREYRAAVLTGQILCGERTIDEFWVLFVMHDEAHRRFGVIFRNRKPALLEEIKKIRECGADVIHAVRLAKRRGGAHKCIEHKSRQNTSSR